MDYKNKIVLIKIQRDVLKELLQETTMNVAQYKNYLEQLKEDNMEIAVGFDGKFTLVRFSKADVPSVFVMAGCNSTDKFEESVGVAVCIAKYFSRNRDNHYDYQIKTPVIETEKNDSLDSFVNDSIELIKE